MLRSETGISSETTSSSSLEIARLRLEIERLQKKEHESAVPQSTPSTERVLKPRASGKPFDIRGWVAERQFSKESLQKGVEKCDSLVPVGDVAECASQASVPEAEVTASQPEEECSSRAITWIPQPSLMGSGRWSRPEFTKVKECFTSVVSELVSGTTDAAKESFRLHHHQFLQDETQPYLGFSAMIPLLFRTVGGFSLSDAIAGGEACDKVDEAFERCADLIRHLISTSRFGGKPPPRQPDDMPRPLFVRELCAQAGLSLDLARLGHVQRQSHAKPDLDGDPLPVARELCVSNRDLKNSFSRAGRYLQSVQMDMERLRDERVVADERVAAEKSAAARVPAAPVPQPTIDVHDTVPADGTTGTVCEAADSSVPLPLQDAEDMQTLEQLVGLTVVPSVPSATSTAATPTVETGGTPATDPVQNILMSPSFGKFVDHQLFPLYVADIPFAAIKNMMEYYCGTPLNSDHEDAAWKSIGETKSRRHRLTQASAETPRTALASVPLPGPLAETTSITQLLDTSGAKPSLPKALRQQFPTSVVEKRHKSISDLSDRARFAAPPDMSLSKLDAKLSASKKAIASRALAMVAPSTPAPRQRQTPLASRCQSPAHPLVAASPVSVRRQSHAEASVRKHSRPSWSLLEDTPVPKRVRHATLDLA